MSDAGATTATKPVPVQKYRKASSKPYPTFVAAKTAKDAIQVAKTQRVRIRRRHDETFDVVVYEAIQAMA